jgi:hypothetical protein
MSPCIYLCVVVYIICSNMMICRRVAGLTSYIVCVDMVN